MPRWVAGLSISTDYYDIRIQDAPGGGTTFTVAIPVGEEESP